MNVAMVEAGKTATVPATLSVMNPHRWRWGEGSVFVFRCLSGCFAGEGGGFGSATFGDSDFFD